MIVEISFVPIGVGTSLSRYIAKVISNIEKSGLKYQLTPMGTIIEGEWAEISNLIDYSHNLIFEMGIERIITNIKIDYRLDKKSSMQDKIESVKKKMVETDV
ncbi:MAG: MTH1187 family thiamine-binding protein [Candidatus Methanofastidiosum sp.]|nr:MTH1187 family thiamine-binding protein [Methanofastidiosum sp.]NYT14143.1 MTH1187 family thiamine-binding protein [Candidatus Methanofastidiosa archaeon]